MTDSIHIPEEDLALYAMGSLDAAETASIEEHLATCIRCTEALREVTGDLALIGLSINPAELPVGARERFVARIAAEPQQISSFVDSATSQGGLPPALPAGGRGVLPFVMPSPSTAEAGRFDAPPIALPVSRSPVLMALPWLLAAAAMIAAMYLGSQVSELRRSRDVARAQVLRLAADTDRAREVLEALTAPTAQQVTLSEAKRTPAPAGRTSYLPSRGALVFVATNLHSLPSSKAYELWVIPANGGAPIAAGTFRPDDHGTASVVLPPLPVGVPAKAFGVTIERAEGSPVPTSPIILSGS